MKAERAQKTEKGGAVVGNGNGDWVEAEAGTGTGTGAGSGQSGTLSDAIVGHLTFV